MNRMGRMIVFCLIFFMFWEGSALALLSQPISPEEVWLTVYQGMDKGWVVEKMTFLLNQGENHFFFSGQNLLQERFYLHPFESDTSLKTVSTVGSSGYRITLEAGKKGTYPFLISFFENGFDWMERYMGILSEKEKKLYLYPSVFLSNRQSISWKNVHLSWLLGKPSFQLEEMEKRAGAVPETVMEAPSQILTDRELPPVMERVAEYQVFHLPYLVDLPGPSVLQVFPGLRTFPVKEILRFDNGFLGRVLKTKCEGDPLPGGSILLLGVDDTAYGIFDFPLVRTKEEFELSIGLTRRAQVERIEKRLVRRKAEFNEDQEVVGFQSEKEIHFKIMNLAQETTEVEIFEPLPGGAEVVNDPSWQWESGKVRKIVIIPPGETRSVPLVYTFREVL